MTTKGAWYPKGIRAEAREAAKAAAKRAGVPIGQWVESLILCHTESTAPASQPTPEFELIAGDETAEKEKKKKEGRGYPVLPPRRIHRQIRWLAGGSLVTLIFLIAGLGLFWIGQQEAPPPEIEGAIINSEEAAAESAAALSRASLNEIRSAAQAGDREAQFLLGARYARGEWVPKDELAAADWFQKAALQGHPDAQYQLGLLYEEGRVVAQNLFEAFFWFQSAAEQGHLESQFKAGQAYAQGIGIDEDLKKAETLLVGAAERGHGGAMLRLAELYERDEFTEKKPEAAQWRERASSAAPERVAAKEPEGAEPQIIVLDKAPAPETTLDAEALMTLERLLAGLGFAPGPADGVITSETEAAIRLYQDFAGLKIDGQPSRPLLEELRSVSQSAGMPAE